MDLSIDPYTQAIDALFARTAGHIKPGLSRTASLLAAFENPQHRFPSFHVAGTNGKGSVCATLDALLRFKRLRVGRYTSPHLVDFRERILVDGVPISKDEVLTFLALTQDRAEALGATFFEITTAMAFWHFANHHVDVAVIETGLGGTHDSTNVVNPVVATITNIALDHTEYLGPTLRTIAAEKAGIFKYGCAAVVGEPDPAMAIWLVGQASERQASVILTVSPEWRGTSVELTPSGTTFTAVTPIGSLQLTTPLVGEHQVQNTLTAIASHWIAGARYDISLPELNAALASVTLPGRFQRVGDWIFDVAHNPAGTQVLTRTLDAIVPQLARPITAVVGILGDKDWRSMLSLLTLAADHIIITQPKTAPAGRAWPLDEAHAYAAPLPAKVHLIPDFDAAIRHAQAQPGTKVVTGSFHTVGDAMRHLAIDPLIA